MEGTMPDDLRAWIGREEAVEDVLALGPARALAALLDRDSAWIRPGAPLPPLWHWAYLHAPARQSRLGPDGHPRPGDFLPPVPYPRRMWAGGRFTFHHPLQLGEPSRRVSTVAAIQEKEGRSGRFALVTVRHRYHAGGGVALEEEQDLVYRAARPLATSPGAAAAELPLPGWSETLRPTPELLFRFSAVTLNGHRIHYDQPYATGEEGYPGLVVHGPLLALLLLDAAVRNAALIPRTYEYRALAPLFLPEAVHIEGVRKEQGAEVWVRGEDGRLALRALVVGTGG